MNVRKHLTVSLAVVALALGLTTARASAESVLKGSFELPAAAYWGDTLLQPGQYSVWMTTEVQDVGQVHVVHVSGEGISKTFLTFAKPGQESARNYLEVANVGGTYVVRAFDAGILGKSFGFGVTKSVKNKALRASAGPAMEVPVSTGAGI